jgi:hypothetical protein
VASGSLSSVRRATLAKALAAQLGSPSSAETDSALEGDGFELPVPKLVGRGGFEAGRLRTGRAIPDLRRDAALPVRQNTRQGREGGALLNPYFTICKEVNST